MICIKLKISLFRHSAPAIANDTVIASITRSVTRLIRLAVRSEYPSGGPPKVSKLSCASYDLRLGGIDFFVVIFMVTVSLFVCI